MVRILWHVSKVFLFAILTLAAGAGRGVANTTGTNGGLSSGAVGITEKLGDYVPLDLGFLQANGDSLYLRDAVDKPTIITLVYYHCPTICKPLLSGVAEVVDKTDLTPGKDYNIVTISFDQFDNPASATTMKTNITTSLKKPLAPGAWRFLTADSLTIERLTRSVGYQLKRQEKDFAHGTSLIVLSPDGKIVRYLYGLNFLPFDIKMAVSEANVGKVEPSIARVLRFCFSYDPKGRRYVLNSTRIIGGGVLLFAIGFVFFISSYKFRRGTKRPS
jgi:protein SCO1/2